MQRFALIEWSLWLMPREVDGGLRTEKTDLIVLGEAEGVDCPVEVVEGVREFLGVVGV